jgi:hypothetical protein
VDANACTTDSCRATNGCTFTPVAGCRSCQTVAECDDGNPCTRDGCLSRGVCSNVLLAGCTVCTADAQCDDRNPCTTDRCTGGRCLSTPRENGSACGDDDVCNGEETCQAGSCEASNPFPCDDGDPCTTDRCNATAGCTHQANPLCEACGGVPRADFKAQWIAFLPFANSVRMTAIGFLKPAVPIDPVATGLSITIGGASGSIVYRALIPPGGFNAKNTTRKAYRLDPLRARQLRREGLSKLNLIVYEDGQVRVYLRVKGRDLPVKATTALTWNLMFGDQCGASDCRVAPNRPRCF